MVIHDVPQSRRAEHALPGFHPAAVAPDGVDLPIVRDHPERLGEGPSRERIRAETGVDEGHARSEERISKVCEILPQLHRGQHSFIYYDAAREGYDIEVLVRDLLLCMLADAIEPGLEVVIAVLSGDEDLDDGRFACQGGLAEGTVVDRDVPDMGQFQPLFFGLLAQYLQVFPAEFFVLGQKHQTGTVL